MTRDIGNGTRGEESGGRGGEEGRRQKRGPEGSLSSSLAEERIEAIKCN